VVTDAQPVPYLTEKGKGKGERGEQQPAKNEEAGACFSSSFKNEAAKGKTVGVGLSS